MKVYIYMLWPILKVQMLTLCVGLCPLLQAWLTEIHEYAQSDVVIMLLGNKVRRISLESSEFEENKLYNNLTSMKQGLQKAKQAQIYA